MNALHDTSSITCITAYVVTVSILYFSALSLYRLTLHPLAKFPGPKLAGLTYWYEIYYDIYRRGDYTRVILKLHETYGPIIRINPNELHVSDPNFIEVLYTSTGKKREVSSWHLRPFQFEGAHFGTVDHDLHRTRRAPLSRFFSKGMVMKLEPALKTKAIQYCRNLETWAGSGEALDLVTSISCFTTDVVTDYLYGNGYRFLDDPKMKLSLYHPIHMGAESIITFRHFPIYLKLFNAIPSSIMKILSPDAELWRLFRVDARTRIRRIKEDIYAKDAELRTTVFHELLMTLSVAMFYLLSSPETMAKLRSELEAVAPTTDPSAMPPWTKLEQLPYLSGCVYEGLRLSSGLPSRLARSSPDEAIIYRAPDRTWIIPPRYSVGMSAYQIHHNEKLFPQSRKYQPERWFDEGGKRNRQLDQYLLSFSKGSRQCLGMNLAYAELFTLLAVLVRCYGHRLELFETTAEDVDFHHDAMIPTVKPGSKGIRVLVKQMG
ncbi:cytochrome p450 [Diplodia corticola]|uniref:Cytochrome p450 n=1 Tax=Diplodia corticola TaxID=236234 RepID=A0A1J9SLV4_9PEZI|nr:cytochrome p450 [Diplodia corticola]OJD40589.1 cytochrome p450 [Diplodia corticola]